MEITLISSTKDDWNRYFCVLYFVFSPSSVYFLFRINGLDMLIHFTLCYAAIYSRELCHTNKGGSHIILFYMLELCVQYRHWQFDIHLISLWPPFDYTDVSAGHRVWRMECRTRSKVLGYWVNAINTCSQKACRNYRSGIHSTAHHTNTLFIHAKHFLIFSLSLFCLSFPNGIR